MINQQQINKNKKFIYFNLVKKNKICYYINSVDEEGVIKVIINRENVFGGNI